MKTRDACPPLNLASVKYRLAPENPFPAGIDCLLAAKCMLESFPSSNVHISEFTWRQWSDLSRFGIIPQERVKSIPRSDTVSVHMNSASTYFSRANGTWCRSAYLQLDDHDDEDNNQAQIDKHELYQLGSDGCINPVLRLISPQVDIYKELKDRDSAPKQVFVVIASADLFWDDANDLAACLKDQGANIEKYEYIGSHGLGIVFDSTHYDKFAKAWRGGESGQTSKLLLIHKNMFLAIYLSDWKNVVVDESLNVI